MRKEKDVVVADEGRDKGKQFRIVEMPAAQAEAWAIRAFLALGRAGAEIPDGVAQLGLAGLAELGLKAFSSLRWEDAKPLIDEMMKCVQVRPDPKLPDLLRALVEEDIEEVQTRLKLKVEVFNLHTGFSLAGGLSS